MILETNKAQCITLFAGMIKQFLSEVDWGDLDYMLIDTPPGKLLPNGATKCLCSFYEVKSSQLTCLHI